MMKIVRACYATTMGRRAAVQVGHNLVSALILIIHPAQRGQVGLTNLPRT